MASLLIVPSLLILRAIGVFNGSWRPSRRGAARFLRLGTALVLASVPAALIYQALGSTDLAMWFVFVPTLLLVSLVDREYFGWTVPSDGGNPSPTA